jgi:hypothetical protein
VTGMKKLLVLLLLAGIVAFVVQKLSAETA